MDKIGDYIEAYIKGKVPKNLFENINEEMLPYLSPDYLRGFSSPEFYAYPNKSTVQVSKGDVLVLWDGSNAGEIFISKDGILASTMVKLVFDEEKLEKRYFAYTCKHLEYILKAKTAGSGIPHADKGVIKKLEFNMPSFTEQQTIARILSKVDEAIESTEKSIKAADKLKKSLMQNLLTGKLKPDGTWRIDEEYYVDEKLGKVPKGWRYVILKDVIIGAPEYGANASALNYEEGMPRFIRITDIDNLGYLIPTDKVGITAESAKKYILKENDFLFARTGDTVGKSLLFKEKMGYAAFAGYLIRMKINTELLLPEYLKIVALSDIFEDFKSAMKRVGAKPNIR